jgi:hypothetical protein
VQQYQSVTAICIRLCWDCLHHFSLFFQMVSGKVYTNNPDCLAGAYRAQGEAFARGCAPRACRDSRTPFRGFLAARLEPRSASRGWLVNRAGLAVSSETRHKPRTAAVCGPVVAARRNPPLPSCPDHRAAAGHPRGTSRWGRTLHALAF